MFHSTGWDQLAGILEQVPTSWHPVRRYLPNTITCCMLNCNGFDMPLNVAPGSLWSTVKRIEMQYYTNILHTVPAYVPTYCAVMAGYLLHPWKERVHKHYYDRISCGQTMYFLQQYVPAERHSTVCSLQLHALIHTLNRPVVYLALTACPQTWVWARHYRPCALWQETIIAEPLSSRSAHTGTVWDITRILCSTGLCRYVGGGNCTELKSVNHNLV